jgi:hypothetical protein
MINNPVFDLRRILLAIPPDFLQLMALLCVVVASHD